MSGMLYEHATAACTISVSTTAHTAFASSSESSFRDEDGTISTRQHLYAIYQIEKPHLTSPGRPLNRHHQSYVKEALPLRLADQQGDWERGSRPNAASHPGDSWDCLDL
ncbi:hypothetical protein B0J13DRAFT_531805 [Dactylonectria estremocensis]|uniref:Uncharacterized protein n=1 Tax=Dactylonectria estremocensis TaxID=1079267 RepID=A0A9P9DN27_9HYPO|nr:hypothetical protein B0J13DRAFT_531805 [Dactylonectria estremocensis]